MKRSWTLGIKDAERVKDIKQEYASSAILRERLQEMLDKMQESARRQNISEMSYDNPNWALKQADYVGYMRAFEEIKNIL